MVSLYAVWVPAVVFAHTLAFSLFLYSLEQIGVLGQVRRFLCKRLKAVKAVCGQQSGQISLSKTRSEQATQQGPVQLSSDGIGGLGSVLSASAVEVDASLLEAPLPADLHWTDISYQVVEEASGAPKAVLRDCAGRACAGETVALMGPSGAGKTTLLDVLAGRIRGSNLQGEVFLNGKPDRKHLRRCSQYVMQEDVFVATQTVLETLKFRAGLCMPSAVPQTERLQCIASVLDVMGLAKVRHSKIGGLLPGGIVVRGISGGEKRRLSIACALLSNPSILFLDEPTTGLDSFAALSAMEHMTQLSCSGHTIVASIHQPRSDIFARFNLVVILSEGYQLFSGPPSQCVAWFSTHSDYTYDSSYGAVSDWIMDTVSVSFTKPADIAKRSMTSLDDVMRAADSFKAYAAQQKDMGTLQRSMSCNSMSSPSCLSSTMQDRENGLMATRSETSGIIPGPKTLPDKTQWASEEYAVRWHQQYLVLLKRSVLSQLRNPTDTANRLLIAIWVSIASGVVFASLPEGAGGAQLRLSSHFFMLLLFMLLPFSFMSFFVADRRFYQSDVAAGLYAPSAYYFAAVTASTPPVILNTVCGGLIAYGLTGLRYTAYAIFMYLVVLVFEAVISQQMLIFCVWLTPNQDMAYTIATGYVALSILLAGFYIRISAIKAGFVRALSWLTYTKYSVQAMGRIELLGRVWGPETCQPVQGSAPGVSGSQQGSCVAHGETVLEFYGYTINTGVLIAALATAYILSHIGSYLALSRVHKVR